LDPNVAQVIVKAEGVAPLVRRSAKGSADIRIAALSVLRDVAKHGHSLIDSGQHLSPLFLNGKLLGFRGLLLVGSLVVSEVSSARMCIFRRSWLEACVVY
jgi:hypothetical protein